MVVLSCGIDFRLELVEALADDEQIIKQHFAKIPDPYIRDVEQQVFLHGAESPRFTQAITKFEKILTDLDKALATQQWIVGDRLTLADIAYAPYATRLGHLHLHSLRDNKPHFARWYQVLQATPGYQAGLTQWFNPK